MKTLKKNVLLLGVVMASLLMTGCGGTQTSSSSKKSSQPSISSDDEPSSEVNLPDYKVTIDYNDGTTAKVEKTVHHGSPIEKPTNPTAPAGKKFYGWMNTKNGGQIWDFESEDIKGVYEDVELKPLFVDASLDPQLLEAELCPAITEDRNGQGMEGATYSGGAKGKQLVNRAYDGEYLATGSYFQEDSGTVRYARTGDPAAEVFAGYVHFMYAKGDTLTWKVNSSAAATNVTILMRLCGEYAKPDEATGEKKFTVTDDEFQIKVNGTALKYGKVTLHNLPDTGKFTTFQDFFVSAEVSLKAGENTIQTVVNNDINLFSTIAAAAPCVDCIKVISSSTLTWPDAKLSTLERQVILWELLKNYSSPE